jgi:hypothetical protein
MEWVQFIIFFLGVFGLFIWNRAEGRADMRHMDTKLEGQRAMMQAIWTESKQNQEKWHEISTDFNEKYLNETKEFHARLCSIEEKHRR